MFDQTRVEIARGLGDGRIDPARVACRNVLKRSPEQAARLYARRHAFWMGYEASAREPADDGHFYAFTVALYPNDMAPMTTTARPRAPRARQRHKQE